MYNYFKIFIEELQNLEYELPVEFQKINMHINKLNPLEYTTTIDDYDDNNDQYGGSYKPLPKAIEATKGVVNVKNNDQLCFLHSINALRHPAKINVSRVSNYQKYLPELKYNEEEFPMNVSRIRFFEIKNNIGINVHGC